MHKMRVHIVKLKYRVHRRKSDILHVAIGVVEIVIVLAVSSITLNFLKVFL